jgi:nucleoside triphosphatase
MTQHDTEYAVPATGALILNDEDEIFLMKSPKWNGQWLVPGGKVEKGDTMQETVRKEVREETGLELDDLELVNVKDGSNPDDFSRDTHFIFLNFVCRATDQDVELDQREAVDYTWIDPEEALESDLDINDSTREFIRTFLDQNN